MLWGPPCLWMWQLSFGSSADGARRPHADHSRRSQEDANLHQVNCLLCPAAVQAMNILPLVKLFCNIRYVVHRASYALSNCNAYYSNARASQTKPKPHNHIIIHEQKKKQKIVTFLDSLNSHFLSISFLQFLFSVAHTHTR